MFRALLGELEASIIVGNRTTGLVVTAMDNLSGLNPPVRQNLIWTDVSQLLQSLSNQSQLADQYNSYQQIFGIGTYNGKDPVKRALIGELESSIQTLQPSSGECHHAE